MIVMLVLMAVLLGVSGWILSRIMVAGGSEDALDAWAKALITVGCVATIFYAAWSGSLLAPFVIVACSIPIALIWTPHFVNWAFRPLWAAWDGGSQEVEARPFYHRAVAFRNRGDYEKAIEDIRGQLELFPGNFDGLMLLAEIQSDNLKDIPAAMGTLTLILSESGSSDRDQILAYNRMADLYLRQGDRDGARQTLERIVAQWPKTESARFAEQRLAHLPTDEVLAAQAETPKVTMREYEQNIGLKLSSGTADAPFESPREHAVRLVKRLREFPQDWEARETLAMLYAKHLERMDLAVLEYETLITAPNQPQKEVARWLNQLADLQMASPENRAAARATLLRIVELLPGTVWAETAESRIARLAVGARGTAERPRIKLGQYEQNIGLKRFDRPDPPTPEGV